MAPQPQTMQGSDALIQELRLLRREMAAINKALSSPDEALLHELQEIWKETAAIKSQMAAEMATSQDQAIARLLRELKEEVTAVKKNMAGSVAGGFIIATVLFAVFAACIQILSM